MEERMRLLEDALFIIQDGSCKPYPLLDGQLLESGDMKWQSEVDEDLVMDNDFSKYGLVDAFGSLYINGKGSSSDGPAPLGTSGGSEQAKVLVAELSSPASHAEEINLSYFPQEISVLHQAFPFTPPGISAGSVQDVIESYLPPFPRATALCETFLQSTSWVFNIVSRQYILGELIPVVYRYARGQIPKQPRPYGPHDIALLFVVFALGALVDPSLPPHNVEGQHYHILSRAAICLESVFARRSVVTIKALNLMSIYNGMCGIENKLEQSSSLLNLAAHVALQVRFLHYKDPSVWGMTGREAYERRTCFWCVRVLRSLRSFLISGRPPVILPSFIDCHIPTEEEEDMYQSGEAPLGFGIWSFSFTMQCLVPVVEATQGARPPSYDAVLALDCKIREFLIPQVSSSSQTLGDMQTFVRSQLREITLLFLHRNFFARALADFPLDPLKSPLRQSFLTAYQSATRVLNTTRKQFAHQPVLCARVWRVWSVAFSAAVIVAAVAIKRSSVDLEPEPFGQLDLACTLFREASRMSVRAQKALPILLRLHQEATQIRLDKTLQLSEPGTTVPVANQESRDSHRIFVDSRHPISSMRRAGVPSPPSSRYAQALPVPVVHPPLARVVGSDEHPCEGTGARVPLVPLVPHGLHHEISPLTSPASHGLPSAPYVIHTPAYEVSLEDRWTSFTHDRTGTRVHSRLP
ncbi:hypothetical protein JVT61DRAFT_8257 [Boletus reticuloceps]|uniref:Xylanolytic transcriptional activator regulatory domain-containing protein n=1 Tax=Boletus reticuloceps TaxID=495285 RepID=A0A8I3ACB4_9AGAM|nr:hypothetical protein JVT61DRAFT_8257 [Boletus reticuloceps]